MSPTKTATLATILSALALFLGGLAALLRDEAPPAPVIEPVEVTSNPVEPVHEAHNDTGEIKLP